MTKNILILAGDFVEDYEIMVPYQSLLLLGLNVHVVCPDKKNGDKIKTGVHNSDIERPGHNFTLNYSFADVKPETYHGLVLPGGRSPEYLRLNKRVIEITQHFLDTKKPILSICHGAQILAAVKGALVGKTLGAFYGCKAEIEVAGGIFHTINKHEAYVHENIVTTPAWPGHPESLRLFSELLGVKITHS